MQHKPVLLQEVLDAFNPQPGQDYIDGTVGQGGHTQAILERTAPNGRVMGMDLDPRQIENARITLEALGDRFVPVNASYARMREEADKNGFKEVAGVLLDVGFSSWQVDESQKGFSFLRDEPLDMRYDPQGNPVTAKQIVNDWPEAELVKIFEGYGEERFARRIAKQICEERRRGHEISTTFELVQIIKEATPAAYWHGHIHYATRTFQALRIAVNGELDNLQKGMEAALQVLASGGKLAVISFHSLEDRVVKQFFKLANERGLGVIQTKKPIEAGEMELADNPRARSAKLRVFQKQ